MQGNPNLYRCELLADDNILNIAEFDLKYQRTPNQRLRQSGHCVSGLTIANATRRVREMDSEHVNHVIVNVGSIDIVQGRQLIQMVNDFMSLISILQHKEINPIFTTLAPLPGNADGNKKETLNGFNHFLRETVSEGYSVIDLHKCMVKPDGTVDLNLYQVEPRYMSGSRKTMTMWNKIGRNRILGMLIKNLGPALVYDGGYIGSYF